MATFNSLPVEILEDICLALGFDLPTLSSLSRVNKIIGDVARAALWQRIYLQYDLSQIVKRDVLDKRDFWAVAREREWPRIEKGITRTRRFLDFSEKSPHLLLYIRKLSLRNSQYPSSAGADLKRLLRAVECCRALEQLEVASLLNSDETLSVWLRWPTSLPTQHFFRLKKLVLEGSKGLQLSFLACAPNLEEIRLASMDGTLQPVGDLLDPKASKIRVVKANELSLDAIPSCFWKYIACSLESLSVCKWWITEGFVPGPKVRKLILTDEYSPMQQASWMDHITHLSFDNWDSRDLECHIRCFPNVSYLKVVSKEEELSRSYESLAPILRERNTKVLPKLEHFCWQLDYYSFSSDVEKCENEWNKWIDSVKPTVRVTLRHCDGTILTDTPADQRQ